MTFNDVFLEMPNSPLHHIGKQKTSIIWEKRNCRAKRSEIWDSRVVDQQRWGTFDLVVLMVILRSLGDLKGPWTSCFVFPLITVLNFKLFYKKNPLNCQMFQELSLALTVTGNIYKEIC